MVSYPQRIDQTECFRFAYQKKRQSPKAYGYILIARCSHDSWWYKDLVGEVVFCELWFSHNYWREGIPILSKAIVVRLWQTKEMRGMDIAPEDLVLL